MIDRMLDTGDNDGRQVWRRIKLAIETLLAAPNGMPNWEVGCARLSSGFPTSSVAPRTACMTASVLA